MYGLWHWNPKVLVLSGFLGGGVVFWWTILCKTSNKCDQVKKSIAYYYKPSHKKMNQHKTIDTVLPLRLLIGLLFPHIFHYNASSACRCIQMSNAYRMSLCYRCYQWATPDWEINVPLQYNYQLASIALPANSVNWNYPVKGEEKVLYSCYSHEKSNTKTWIAMEKFYNVLILLFKMHFCYLEGRILIKVPNSLEFSLNDFNWIQRKVSQYQTRCSWEN